MPKAISPLPPDQSITLTNVNTKQWVVETWPCGQWIDKIDDAGINVLVESWVINVLTIHKTELGETVGQVVQGRKLQ